MQQCHFCMYVYIYIYYVCCSARMAGNMNYNYNIIIGGAAWAALEHNYRYHWRSRNGRAGGIAHGARPCKAGPGAQLQPWHLGHGPRPNLGTVSI